MPRYPSPGPLCQVERPLAIDDGTACRAMTAPPGIQGPAATSIATWTASHKMLYAARLAGDKLPAGMREEFLSLFSPAALGTTAAAFAAWVALQFVGIGEIADALLLLVGVFTVGVQAIDAAKDLATFVQLSRSASSQADIDRAATALAKAVAILGVTAFTVLIFKAGKGGGQPAKVQGGFWEAYNFEPDRAGTSVSMRFTLKVDGREFDIKPNATKHMAETSRSRFRGPATVYSQTDFPITPLAAALEQVSRRDLLKPLIQGQIPRLGTPDAPLRIDEWELAIEYVNGKFEVLHAVYRR